MLSDFNVTFPFIALFSLVTFLLSLATKFIIDNRKLISVTVFIFFLISTVGFLALALLFLYRAVNIMTAKPPEDSDVIGKPDIL